LRCDLAGVRQWFHGYHFGRQSGGRKAAQKTLKEKRLAKKAKKATHTNESFDNTFGH